MGKVQQARKMIDVATDLLLKEIENKARKVLRDHSNLEEFIMGMGTAFFSTKTGETISVDERAYLKPLFNIFNEFNSLYSIDLKLDGTAMRFTATGKTITKW